MTIPASTKSTMNACIHIHEGDTRQEASIATVTPEPRTPAERADSLLRAAEATARAARGAPIEPTRAAAGTSEHQLNELADQLHARARAARDQLDRLQAAIDRLAASA
jgi:hypothetical protein